MKVIVIGAGGVIGQHMMISVPPGVEATFTRRSGDGVLYTGLELCDEEDWIECLETVNPDVVVNLAGESRVDVVEQHPEAFYQVNVMAPARLRAWCDENGKHLIHVSSQIVLDPVNEYGKQKVAAEEMVKKGDKWTIVRPTFVLGVRPFPGIGRENVAERILAGREEVSVDDRYFSVSFAWDVAEFLWDLVTTNQPARTELQIGNQETMSRLSVARALGVYPKAVRHDSLPKDKIAQRPVDTTYKTSWSRTKLSDGFSRLEMEFGHRSLDAASYRAKEIAAYLGIEWWKCLDKLNTGFGVLHGEVAADFRKHNPNSDRKLLEWYRDTEAYIWELTAYHLDERFNYVGMCKGITEALSGRDMKTVLCLGDGVGDLSLYMEKAGLEHVCYHDLFQSITAQFAESKFLMRLGDDWSQKINLLETAGFDPITTPEERAVLGMPEEMSKPLLDAIVSLDFLEHLPNVEAWVRAVYANLKPGGWFCAQNAFNCGSGPEGSIPMHLTVNDRFEKDWDPLLSSIGFVQESSNWYRKPE